MRRVSLQILKEINKKPSRTTELAEKLGKSQSWISAVTTDLEKENLVKKNRKIKPAETYEATLLRELLDNYNLEKILAGKKENILKTLLVEEKTLRDLESEGFAKTTVYNALNDLKAAGVVAEAKGSYRITNETLEKFLDARTRSKNRTPYKTNGEKIIVTRDTTSEKGKPTAFSAFRRYGIDYYPAKTYLYEGRSDLGIENVLIHSVLCAENKKQMAMCGVFYLNHKNSLNIKALWELSEKWRCREKLADLLAFIDQRKVKNDKLFFSWGEFASLVTDYGVDFREKHSEDKLLAGLEKIGGILENSVDAYLLGGVNLILRGVKDTTKDIDIVLENRKNFQDIVNALRKNNYEERYEIGREYERLKPSIVLEKQGFPRWDIFVGLVANCLYLTEEMKSRSEEYTVEGNLHLHLLSPTDIFLFKSVTDREGDLEDAALIARQKEINWKDLLNEIKKQDELTERYPSFTVLDTLDILAERYSIDPPIRNRLSSYCLENALLLSLERPKTIKDLRKDLDFPEHQIYNKLRKLENENRITVNRKEKLNKYKTPVKAE